MSSGNLLIPMFGSICLIICSPTQICPYFEEYLHYLWQQFSKPNKYRFQSSLRHNESKITSSTFQETLGIPLSRGGIMHQLNSTIARLAWNKYDYIGAIPLSKHLYFVGMIMSLSRLAFSQGTILLFTMLLQSFQNEEIGTSTWNLKICQDASTYTPWL